MTAGAHTPIRPASEADDSSVRDLLREFGLPLEGLEDTWRRWVADNGNGIDGVVAMERHGELGEAVYLLRSLAVRVQVRGSGLGGDLVRAALAGADNQEGRRAQVALLTETAVGYFDRLGFSRIAREAVPRALAGSAELTGACPASAVAYARD